MAKTNNFSTPYQLLGSLAHELKNPLTLIARKAELEALNIGESAFSELQDTAERTLKLIDSYLLMAQSEYGQVKLPIETIGVGSVIYEVLQELGPVAEKNRVLISTNIKDSEVMSHKPGLKAAIWCLVRLSIDFMPGEGPKKRSEIVIRTKSHTDQLDILVLSSNLDVEKKDIVKARSMQGNSRMALCLKNEGSGIQLAIADILASSLGDGLNIASHNGMKGFVIRLKKSHQLQLI